MGAKMKSIIDSEVKADLDPILDLFGAAVDGRMSEEQAIGTCDKKIFENWKMKTMAASIKSFVGVISPGRYLTRDGVEVYIAGRSNFAASGGNNYYPWWVEDGVSGWSVDEAGRHMKDGITQFDIVSRVQMVEG